MWSVFETSPWPKMLWVHQRGSGPEGRDVATGSTGSGSRWSHPSPLIIIQDTARLVKPVSVQQGGIRPGWSNWGARTKRIIHSPSITSQRQLYGSVPGSVPPPAPSATAVPASVLATPWLPSVPPVLRLAWLGT